MSENFYDVLGVDAGASSDEITTAYRERIKETHPDQSDAPDAEEQAKRVIEAKEVLTDADERARYDSLGHAAYVRDTNVDADWQRPTDTRDETDAEPEPESRKRREEPGPGSGAQSVYEGTWSDAGSEGRESATDTETESSTAGDGATGAEQSAGSRSASHTGTDRNQTGEKRRRRQRRSTRARTNQNVGEAVGWASGVDGRHAVRNGSERTRLRRENLFPPRESLVLLVSMFICYPALVFSSVFPPFPLVVNATVGLCTLLLVAYLMSMPEVGLFVFGGWTVLGTLGLIASGVSLFSLVGVLVLGTTWVPLVVTFATFSILRW